MKVYFFTHVMFLFDTGTWACDVYLLPAALADC